MSDDYGLTGYDASPVTWPAFGYTPMRNVFPRPGAWRYLDWTAEAGGYRLVIEGGAILGLERLGDPFTCDVCGQTFTRAWSDEEAMAEARSLYPAEHLDAEEPGVVCDDCFQVVMLWAEQDAPELLLNPEEPQPDDRGWPVRRESGAWT